MLNEFRSSIMRCCLLAMCLLLMSCGKQDEKSYQPSVGERPQPARPEYVVGIFPVSNPQRLNEMYGPIVDYLNARIPEVHIKMEGSHDFQDFEQKLYNRQFHFALGNPYHVVQSLKHGYRTFAKMGNDKDFRGVILVRKDSGIRTVKDLKGKTVSYPAQSALAATLMPQYYLQTHGIDVNRDIRNIYVGSQESSILNVFHGRVAAGGAWLVSWRIFMMEHPKQAGQLVVRWTTEPLLDNGWIVRKDIPPPIADKVAHLLLHLHESEQGKALLQRLSQVRFDAASNATYQPVHAFLEKYSGTVRRIDH